MGVEHFRAHRRDAVQDTEVRVRLEKWQQGGEVRRLG